MSLGDEDMDHDDVKLIDLYTAVPGATADEARQMSTAELAVRVHGQFKVLQAQDASGGPVDPLVYEQLHLLRWVLGTEKGREAYDVVVSAGATVDMRFLRHIAARAYQLYGAIDGGQLVRRLDRSALLRLLYELSQHVDRLHVRAGSSGVGSAQHHQALRDFDENYLCCGGTDLFPAGYVTHPGLVATVAAKISNHEANSVGDAVNLALTERAVARDARERARMQADHERQLRAEFRAGYRTGWVHREI
jgi:hypothetical protein